MTEAFQTWAEQETGERALGCGDLSDKPPRGDSVCALPSGARPPSDHVDIFTGRAVVPKRRSDVTVSDTFFL